MVKKNTSIGIITGVKIKKKSKDNSDDDEEGFEDGQKEERINKKGHSTNDLINIAMLPNLDQQFNTMGEIRESPSLESANEVYSTVNAQNVNIKKLAEKLKEA